MVPRFALAGLLRAAVANRLLGVFVVYLRQLRHGQALATTCAVVEAAPCVEQKENVSLLKNKLTLFSQPAVLLLT